MSDDTILRLAALVVGGVCGIVGMVVLYLMNKD
ncbi:MAG: hypothetical protein JWQ01_4812 [Massilia sp.]|nr:hypothetical protein [Massilia sp.]